MHPVWEWLPAIYLFLGGLGSGAFLVAATFEFAGKRYEFDFSPTTLVGATVPGPLVALGTVLLIFDLGAGLREPWRIFLMFTHPTSVMTWGVWILTFFIPLSFVYGFLELMDVYPGAWERMKNRASARRLPFVQQLPIRRTKRIVAAVGSAFAVGTALYTGILLSAVGPAIPLWSTPILPFIPVSMMPILFLISAVSTGVGLTVDLSGTLFVRDMQHRIPQLPLIHLALIGAETLLLGMLLITAFANGGAASQAALDIVIGPHSLVFWLLIVLPGFIFPFVVHAYAVGLGGHSAFSGLGSGVGIIVAGLFLRYLILISGLPAALL
ncbi:MAG: polysulfide reductase NrfD [Anaerolineae bacterium]|jgi:formate-dependent nitrite reductase membrane component NrfD